jgi:hypothetical protein
MTGEANIAMNAANASMAAPNLIGFIAPSFAVFANLALNRRKESHRACDTARFPIAFGGTFGRRYGEAAWH